MKTYSNIPLPDTPQRWKEGEYALYINHIDNGYLPTGDPDTDMSSKRYEAEFTIVRELTAQSAVHAFTRMTTDPELDQQVIDTIEVNGGNALDVVREYETNVSTTVFPPLPDSGFLEQGQIYSYTNGAVMVVQSHNRTIYPPELTPALFSFYREITEGQPWIANEMIELNATRTYNDKLYKCIQAHMSLVGWEPPNTPALWVEVQEEGGEIPVWVRPTGAHDCYNIGDQVHFPTADDPVYESVINGNVWSPIEYGAGWRLV